MRDKGRLRTQLPNSPAVGSVSLPAWKVVTTTTLTGIWSWAGKGRAKRGRMAKAIRPEQLKNFIWFRAFGRGYRLSGGCWADGRQASQLRSLSSSGPKSAQNEIHAEGGTAASAIELKNEESAKAKRIVVGADVHLRGYQAARKIDNGVIGVVENF